MNAHAWFVLDVIPVPEISERLDWPMAVTSTGSWIGVSILAFQAIVILIAVPTNLAFRRPDASWNWLASMATVLGRSQSSPSRPPSSGTTMTTGSGTHLRTARPGRIVTVADVRASCSPYRDAIGIGRHRARWVHA